MKVLQCNTMYVSQCYPTMRRCSSTLWLVQWLRPKCYFQTSGQCNETLPFQIPTWKGNFNGALHATWSWSLLNAMQCLNVSNQCNGWWPDQPEDTNGKTFIALSVSFVLSSASCDVCCACAIFLFFNAENASLCYSFCGSYILDSLHCGSVLRLFLTDFFLLVSFVCVIDAGGRYNTVDNMLKIGQRDNAGDYFRQKPANKSGELNCLEI